MLPIRSSILERYALLIVFISLDKEIISLYYYYIKRGWYILQLQLPLIANLFFA